MTAQFIEYFDQETLLQAYCVRPNTSEPTPLVIVCHDWSGQNEFARDNAHAIAELGYIGFAIDMYGKNKVGTTPEEKSVLLTPLRQDRGLLQRRINAGFNIAQQQPNILNQKIASIGFCFGGLCSLDLARTGADLSAVVSFHGQLMAPGNIDCLNVKADILALHGHNDPMVPPEEVLAFEQEMTAAKADWQMHTFSDTYHAFMNPDANDVTTGNQYNPKTEKRAWQLMQDFLEESFKG